MPINPSDIPDRMKRLMSKEDRKGLGDLAPTAAEVNEKATHKCEKEMQETIKAYLEQRGWFYDWDPMHKKRTGTSGAPDFRICVPIRISPFYTEGVYVAIECKMPSNGLSGEQLHAMEKIQSASGRYLIATSAKQALEFLKGLAE